MIGLLTLLIFVAFHQGMNAFFKGQAHNELLSQLQVSIQRISVPLRQSSNESVSIRGDGAALAFLTNYDSNDKPQTEFGTGLPEWQAYWIFYHDPDGQTIRQNRVDLTAGASQKLSPTPLQDYYGVSLATAFSGLEPSKDRPIAHRISALKISPNPSLAKAYDINIEAAKPREGSHSESMSKLSATILVRN